MTRYEFKLSCYNRLTRFLSYLQTVYGDEAKFGGGNYYSSPRFPMLANSIIRENYT